MLLSLITSIVLGSALTQALPQLLGGAASCSSLELVISRGTFEFGTYGFIVGDPLFSATQKLIPDVTGYAVPYPASFDQGSEAQGTAAILSHFKSQSSACPDQKYVIVGYSQGAAISHNASAVLDPSLYSRVVALVMFGDQGLKTNAKSPITGLPIPPFPAALAQKLRENCAPDDSVCNENSINFLAHLSYNNPGTDYISSSAAYIQKQFKSGGTSGPETDRTGTS